MSESGAQTFLGKVFSEVERPGRYAGGEWNERRKDPGRAAAKVALVFPDVYEIGMSYLGQKILYALINDRPEFLAERVYAPWPDFEAALRRHKVPLFSLENKIPLKEFDILGFSLLYELNYSNILTILDLGHVPFRSAQRDLDFPLVIAGGPASFNPEPVADFFDLFLLGDGEEAVLEIIDRYRILKQHARGKGQVLKELARMAGVYVPSLYTPYFPAGSRLMAVRPSTDAPAAIEKRVLSSFSRSDFPEKIIVPNIQVVFDRVAVEVSRGCLHKCRFCQATSLYSPYRVKDPSIVVQKIFKSLRSTGYEDASLFSLSVGDYPYLEGTVRTLMEGLERDRVSLSLSSLRPKALSAELVRNIIRVRKTGFTLVPEAGSERLRRVINKDLQNEDIWKAAAHAFEQGWKLLKLYFMIGLPTEKDEDLVDIVTLVNRLIEGGRQVLRATPRINVSLSSFIPKPHTPFQWLSMDDEKTLLEKQRFIKSHLKKMRSVEIKDHPVMNSVLEAVFTRGDRRLAGVLQRAWEGGARFDSWRDHFRFSVWQESFEKEAVDYRAYLGEIDRQAVLPWDHIRTGMKKSFLLQELERALKEENSPSCLDAKCGQCQGCDFWTDTEKQFSRTLEVQPPEQPYLGRPTNTIFRYQAFYAKTGPARFVSHHDLMNILHRAFRRTGVAAVFSEGFHPKMQMSFVPALPLGMEGKDESFEFRSQADMAEEEFLSALNGNVPAGIQFTALKKIDREAPSLTERIQSMVYSLDMTAEKVQEALGAMARTDGERHQDPWAVAEKRVDGYLLNKNDWVESVRLDTESQKLILRLRFATQRSIRPQDLAAQIFDLKEAVSMMAREKIILAAPEPRPSQPVSTVIDRP
jgi:radical SAM family uncharacterized protein/radical SAM-linked protein